MLPKKEIKSSYTKSQQGEALSYLSNLDQYNENQRKAALRASIYNVFSEGFMIAISLMLIPILVLPLFFYLPPFISSSLLILNYVIIALFILEYVLKIGISDEKSEYAKDPWHILDLFIIIVSVGALPIGLFPQGGGAAILLRLLRLPAAFSLGGRTLERKRYFRDSIDLMAEQKPMKESYVLLSGSRQEWKEGRYTGERAAGCGIGSIWQNFSNVSDDDLPDLNIDGGLGKLIAEGKIKDWAYPRVERTGGVTVVFLRIPETRTEVTKKDVPWLVRWKGILLIDCGEGIVSISKGEIDSLKDIPVDAEGLGAGLDISTIIFLLAKRALDVVEQFLLAAEIELVRLGAIPMAKQSRPFLTATYSAKREVGYMLSWLVHLREVMKKLLDETIPLTNLNDRHREQFERLSERTEFLLESAGDISDSFSDSIDYYLNSTSLQMNQVMKIIAVLTALAIVPTVVGGLLGMNLIGNPWSISLTEVSTIVAVIMMATAWVYYRLGWLKT